MILGVKKRLSIVIVIALVLLQDINTEATAYGHVVSITFVAQIKSKWCWAACAEMNGKNAYPASNRTQSDVVHYLKGSIFDPYPNSGGNLDDSANGSSYVTFFNNPFYISGAWSFSQISNSIQSDKVITAAAGFYDSSGNRNGGHCVVIFGYSHTEVGSYVSDQIKYRDPATNATYECNYSDFCDGSFNSRIYDGTVYY